MRDGSEVGAADGDGGVVGDEVFGGDGAGLALVEEAEQQHSEDGTDRAEGDEAEAVLLGLVYVWICRYS